MPRRRERGLAEPVEHPHHQGVSDRLADGSVLPVAAHYHDAGGLALVGEGQLRATAGAEACEEETSFTPTYELSDPLATKI